MPKYYIHKMTWCPLPAEEISISVPLNVNIFSCDCIKKYEGVPAALHCDEMREKALEFTQLEPLNASSSMLPLSFVLWGQWVKEGWRSVWYDSLICHPPLLSSQYSDYPHCPHLLELLNIQVFLQQTELSLEFQTFKVLVIKNAVQSTLFYTSI